MENMNIVLKIIELVLSGITSAGVIVAIINFLLAKKQYLSNQKKYLSNYERACKKDTIDIFHEIKKEAKEIERQLYTNEPVIMDDINQNRDLYFEIKEYLSLLERFSVGVNTGIYDLNIADRLSGSFFINKYYQFHPFILDIRQKRQDKRLYDEFETMVKKLEKIRQNRLREEGNIIHSPNNIDNKTAL